MLKSSSAVITKPFTILRFFFDSFLFSVLNFICGIMTAAHVLVTGQDRHSSQLKDTVILQQIIINM